MTLTSGLGWHLVINSCFAAKIDLLKVGSCTVDITRSPSVFKKVLRLCNTTERRSDSPDCGPRGARHI